MSRVFLLNNNFNFYDIIKSNNILTVSENTEKQIIEYIHKQKEK